MDKRTLSRLRDLTHHSDTITLPAAILRQLLDQLPPTPTPGTYRFPPGTPVRIDPRHCGARHTRGLIVHTYPGDHNYSNVYEVLIHHTGTRMLYRESELLQENSDAPSIMEN